MITHLEEDILRWEVKWAFGSITTNKPSGSDGILVEVFQILKYNAVKVLHLICTQFSSGSAMSNSLQPHGLQHSRLPCPLPTPRVYSNSCPIELVTPSSHLILCCPPLPPPIFPSIRVFSNESALHIRWTSYWS